MEYKFLSTSVEPCYIYIEGSDAEEFWVDSQNCYYFTFIDKESKYDENTNLIDGKKYWIICPVKPSNSVIKSEEDFEKLVKWVVCVSSDDNRDSDSDETYIYREWDFEKHTYGNIINVVE